MTSVSWHGSTKIMTSYQMVWCHNRFYLKLLGGKRSETLEYVSDREVIQIDIASNGR